MKKRLLAMLLCLCMAATFLPTAAWAAEAEDDGTEVKTFVNISAYNESERKDIALSESTPYYVNGADNATDTETDWNVKLEPAAGTAGAKLTLKDFTLTDGYITLQGNIEVVLEGTNTITCSKPYSDADGADSAALHMNMGDLTISGSGSLTASGLANGIIVHGGLKVTGGTVSGISTAGTTGSAGIAAVCFNISGGTVTGTASTGQNGFGIRRITDDGPGTTITGGTVTGTGAEEGISIYGAVTVSGENTKVTGTGKNCGLSVGTLTVEGGTVEGINNRSLTSEGYTQEGSSGIDANAIKITGGTVKGSAPGNGIIIQNTLDMSGGSIIGESTGNPEDRGQVIHVAGSEPNIRGAFKYRTAENGSETTVSDPGAMTEYDLEQLFWNAYLSVTFTGSTPGAATVTDVTLKPYFTESTSTIKVHKLADDTSFGWASFTAAVTGANYPSQAVTWTVTGSTAATRPGSAEEPYAVTTINEYGALAVSPHETATTLTITATSVEDTSKSASITVTVVAADAHEWDSHYWVYNDTHHWRSCMVGGCGIDENTTDNSTYEEHTQGEDGKCTVCQSGSHGGDEPGIAEIPAPTFSPAGGTYSSAQTVTITAVEGAEIYYTLDGSDPDENNAILWYEGPITISSTTTIKAAALIYENEEAIASSRIVTATYTITGGSGGGGGGGGGAPSTPGTPSNPGTTTNPDGSTTTTTEDKTTGTVTETTKSPDGSQTVVETKKDGTVTTTETDAAGNRTETVEKPDGSSVTKVEQKDGATATVTTDASGKTEAEVELPARAVSDAQEKGETVVLPIPEVTATKSADTAPVVTVKTGSTDAVKVEIPTANVTPGTVAVIVMPDGTEEIIKTSVPTGNGVAVALPDGATVKIVDNSKTFTDVPDGNWAEDAVNFSSARELFSGTSETTFAPETPMTRAMLMTVLARFDGEDTSGGATWYEKGQEWAINNGVSNGSDPDGNVTREQLVVMLWRYSGSPAPTGGLDRFDDAGAVSDFALEAMRWAVENGIINGYGNGQIGPQDQATRAQVAQILKNFIEK